MAINLQQIKQVVSIANNLAQKEGYNLEEYQQPKVKYDALEREWRISYLIKPPISPGRFFTVMVNDVTQESWIIPGK